MGQLSIDRKTLGAGVLVVLVVGVLLGFLFDKGPSRGTGGSPDESVQAAGPTDELNGVPIGYANTEEGAVRAAANFTLVSTSDLIRDADSYEQAMSTLATSTWQDEAREEAQNGHAFAVDHYGLDVEMTTSVLRYRVLSFSQSAASIQLWTVSVATGSARPIPESAWGITTIDLEWTENDWRVAATENQTGPTPAQLEGPSSPRQFENWMEESIEFTEVARP